MAVYYVRKTGNNASAGTSAATAWLTIGKALGATGIASGDTVYVGAGVYREVVTVAMTSATVETRVVGDVDGVQTGDAGEVQWTAYTTNDKTAPSGLELINLAGRDFLTFENFRMVGGSYYRSLAGAICGAGAAGSTNITFRRCVFTGAHNNVGGAFDWLPTVDLAANWTFDSCIALHGAWFIYLQPPTSSVADYDLNIQVTNCLIIGAATMIEMAPTGALAFKPGGLDIVNSTIFGTYSLITRVNSSTTIPCTVYSSVSLGQAGSLAASVLGEIVENYNLIWGARSNVTAGANSQGGTPIPYAHLFEFGQSALWGMPGRQPFSPGAGSPVLGFGNQAGGPTTDMLGVPRPAGSGVWSNALRAIGAYERSNTWVRETTIVRTGANALAATGPAVQDFDLPVDAVATTVTVYLRKDSTYAGTAPQLKVVNGTEAGVADATATHTAAADTWQAVALTFTPTGKGIVTVRLQSNDTAGTGRAFSDDLAVS